MEDNERAAFDRRRREQRPSQLLYAGAIAVVTVGVLAGCQGDEPPFTAAAGTTAITDTSQPATEIAAAFLDAYGSYDVDTAASYLSDDPSLSRLEGGRRDRKPMAAGAGLSTHPRPV